jgi:flagellar basal body rod protein FlgC
MEMSDSLAVSVSGLDAQRRRLNVIASNLANAQSTKTPNGGPYKRRDVVFPQQRFLARFSGPSVKSLLGLPLMHSKESLW